MPLPRSPRQLKAMPVRNTKRRGAGWLWPAMRTSGGTTLWDRTRVCIWVLGPGPEVRPPLVGQPLFGDLSELEEQHVPGFLPLLESGVTE
jgi:hypothetical protein